MPRPRDPEATRAAILDAAEEVFLEQGFGNTALSQISRRAGVTKSLIHHHFGSKEGLWREVKLRRFSVYASSQMEMLEQAPSTQLLRRSFEFYFRFLKSNPQLVRILAWIFLEQDQDECVEIDRKLMTAGLAKLREAQEQGFIRGDLDPRFVLVTFLGLAQHWFQDSQHFMQHFDGEDFPEDVDEAYLRDAMTIFFEGVLPRK